jgi:SAM-dependent methyltransferase
VPANRRETADSDTVDATLAGSLESLDDALNYRDWIVDLAAPHLGDRLLEVGAGHGTFTERFAEFGTVVAVEPGEYAAARLTERFDADDRVTTVSGVAGDVDADADGFDAAVMINVLEHIDDEQGILADLHLRLAADGHLVLWVPAFMLLFSDFDRRLGHHRRYRRGALEELVAANGFEVVASRYVNLPGWFSWLLVVRLAGIEPTNPTTIRIFDRWIVPFVRWIEDRIRMPFGQSIFLVARRAD